MLVIRGGIHKMLVRIANREDPDQTASSEAVWSGSALFVFLSFSKIENIYCTLPKLQPICKYENLSCAIEG